MKSIYFILFACFSVTSCRFRDESLSREKEVLSSISEEPADLELELNTVAFENARFQLTFSPGSLELWDLLPEGQAHQQLASRVAPFRLDIMHTVPGSQLHNGRTDLAIVRDSTGLQIKGIPGIMNTKKVPTQFKNGRDVVRSKNLSINLFDHCPTNYLSANGPLARIVQKSSGPLPVTLDHQAEDNIKVDITKVTYHPDGITWTGTCLNALSWNDISQTKVMAELQFEVRLTADKLIFPEATSDPKYPRLSESSVNAERNGHGTRFLKDYASLEISNLPIQRWNPFRDRIVIDDTKDSAGRKLQTTQMGQWVQEGLKIGVADLRQKIPSLGRKIALTSEQPLLKPDIAFYTGDANQADGFSMMLLDNKNGEIRQARSGIGHESMIYGRINMLQGFAKLGIIDDPIRSYRDSFLLMVLHELGHTLGLRHNFDGYGLHSNWGNDLQSVMSYAMLALPVEYLTDKVEWKPHDLLSLKILYSEAVGNDARSRQALIEEVLQFPLSPDEMRGEGSVGGFKEHFSKALEYLAKTNNPRVTRFREANPDWQKKISRIYKDSYDIDLD